MGFQSQIYRNEPVIDDSTPFAAVVLDGGGHGRGLDLSARGNVDYGYGGVAEPFDPALLIPRHEWQARIEEMEERKSRLSDLMKQAKLPAKNQKQTNFCWIFAPVHCLEIVRLQQNQAYVDLSPASGACQINNFRNEGGWGKDAVKWISDQGVCPSKVWPATAIDRRYLTPEAKQAALNYRLEKWMECVPRNVDQQISMLLRRCPGAAGRNYWRHETTDVDAVWVNGQIGVRIRNQWEGWGDDNYAILQGSRMLADDMVFCLSGSAT